MSVVTYPSGVVGPMPPAPPMRCTVAEYHNLIEIGAFAGDERFELIEGWIIPKMSRNPPHDVAVHKSHKAFVRVLPVPWEVRVQSAITTDDSEPEPDLAVVEGPPDRYSTDHPGPLDIGMLLKIADTPLKYDRVTKARLYARAGIVEYWVLNLIDRQVEVYTDPDSAAADPAYRKCTTYGQTDSVPLVIGGVQVAALAVRDLLPA